MEAAQPEATPKTSKAGFARFLAESFGPLVVFWVLEHTLGLLAAIISSIACGVVLVVLQVVRDKAVSPFTAFVAASVAIFGALDLKYQTGFFVKLEPALGNTITGIFFLSTVAFGKPIIRELAEKQRGSKLPDRASGYLRSLTIVWGFFFFVRAALYVWMAFKLTLDQALAVRAIASPVSFCAMIFGEMGVRWLRWGKEAFKDD